MLTGQVKLPSQMIEIYCDTCGHPLPCHIEWNGNGEPDQGNKWIVSVERCASCDHRREVEHYRRGWEDYKKFGEKLFGKGGKDE